MKEFLNELARLWWIEVGNELTDPLSEKSLNGLRTILKEEYDFDSEVIEYIVESAVKTPSNFHLGGNRESGMQVGTNDTAVSAHLHSDEDDDKDGAIDYDEPLEEEENDEKEDSEDEERPDGGNDKEKATTDIEQNALTTYEKEKLKKEDVYVKNKKSGSVYTVKKANPDTHVKPSKDDIAKAKEDDKSDDTKSDDKTNKPNLGPASRSGIDKFKEFLNSEQLKALDLEGRRKVNRLKELDSLRDSFSELPDEVRNTASAIFAKGQTYEGRPNSGIGKNVLGYLDVKTLSENRDYLLKAYGDGSAKHIKKFVRDSRNVKVSEDYVNSAFDLLPDSFQKALSGKGMTGDDGKGKHFLGYITEDGGVTSDKNDPSIKKDADGNLEVKRGNPPSKDRGKFVWRASLEQGGKDPYTGLPLDLANIDLEHTIAFDNNDNGDPTEQDYLNREHDDNIIICATNINQKKSNLSMKDFIESQVDVQSDKSEKEFTARDEAYSAVNNVASQTEQKAGLMIEGGKLKKGLTSKVLSEAFSIDDSTYDDARDTFKEVVKNKRDQKKISTLKSELGKDTLMAMGLGRGLTKKSGRGTVKLSSDNLYRGFLLSMADNPDRQDEFKEEWENARKVGNSDEFRLAGKGQKGMVSYLIDKGLISDSVLNDKKMGKVFQNALKEIYDEVSNRYILQD